LKVAIRNRNQNPREGPEGYEAKEVAAIWKEKRIDKPENPAVILQ
jgi:hypothetical protein